MIASVWEIGEDMAGVKEAFNFFSENGDGISFEQDSDVFESLGCEQESLKNKKNNCFFIEFWSQK